MRVWSVLIHLVFTLIMIHVLKDLYYHTLSQADINGLLGFLALETLRSAFLVLSSTVIWVLDLFIQKPPRAPYI